MTHKKLFSRINQLKTQKRILYIDAKSRSKEKGDTKDIENYRPISNLCSSSKFYEKLILKRILEIQEEENFDLTRPGQHGFKRNRSTATLSLTIQLIIVQALEDDNHALDAKKAFDSVDHGY